MSTSTYRASTQNLPGRQRRGIDAKLDHRDPTAFARPREGCREAAPLRPIRLTPPRARTILPAKGTARMNDLPADAGQMIPACFVLLLTHS